MYTESIPAAFSFSHSSARNIFTKLFTDLLALAIGAIYSLALFIRFGGFTYWIYLLALFIGFIYSLALFIRFGGFIYWVYPLTLVLVYTVSIPAAFSFSHNSVRNTFTVLSLYISHVLMEKIFRLPSRHHSFLIKLKLLQLHHHTSLIKLTDITSSHFNYYTCSLIKLTNITSLHYHCYMCSISRALHHSNLTSHYSVTIHLQTPSDIHLLHLPPNFASLAQGCAPYSISNYIRNTSKLLLLSGDTEINPGLRPIDQNPVFCSISSKKINQGPQQDVAPTCTDENCNARCHQACNGLSIGQNRHAKDSGRSIN